MLAVLATLSAFVAPSRIHIVSCVKPPLQLFANLEEEDDIGSQTSTTDSESPLAVATTYAGLAANPIAIASLVSLQSTGCPLPRGPFGTIGALETISFLIVAGIVFSWTPEEGGLGSAGLGLTNEDEENGKGIGLQAVVELVSFVVFTAGFVLFVLNLVSPVGGPGACFDAASSAPIDEMVL